MYHLRESDKHFLWAITIAVGIILFWRGVWEGIGELPIIENVWVSLFIGLVILTMSGIIFKEFDPLGGLEKGVAKIVHYVNYHPDKHEFAIHYYDSIKKKDIIIQAKTLHHLEKNHLSFIDAGREIFIPTHRIRRVTQKGVTIWKF